MVSPSEKPGPHPPFVALSWRVQLAVAALVLVVVTLSRLPTFFRSVMNWDESLYFLMAEQWRAGHLPYIVIWDNKPIGIYAIFAAFQAAIGDSILSIRIASVVAITVTALAIARIALLIPAPGRRASLLAAGLGGAAFIICSISNDGLAANAEIFMAAFTALAVLCAISPGFFPTRPLLRGFSVALLFGLAFMTKYVVVFEAPALAFALLWLYPETKSRWSVRLYVGAVVGGILPLAASMLIYLHAGQLHQWFDASLASNFRRAATPMAPLDLGLALKFVKWLPLFLAAAALAISTALLWLRPRSAAADGGDRRFQLFLILWVIGGAIGVSAAKSFYSHYFLQVLPALCVSLAWAATRLPRAWLSPWKIAWAALAVLAIPALAAAAAFFGAVQPLVTLKGPGAGFHADSSTLIGRDIAAEPTTHQPKLYVFDHEPIIYSLARTPAPTRYAYPAFLTTCFLERVAAVDAPQEVDRILSENPEFIVQTLDSIAKLPIDDAAYAELQHAVSDRYDLWRRYDGAVVYRLRPGAHSVAADAFRSANTCR